jgi:pimeloyl-ACP methyl ester carboxylesterase
LDSARSDRPAAVGGQDRWRVKIVERVILTSLLLCVLLVWQKFPASERPLKSAKAPDVEAAVCGSFREPFMFWLWRNIAGPAGRQDTANIQGMEPLKFKTRDGITLAGYKLAVDNPTAYLLVAPGNAMLADHLISDLSAFRDRGWDVYIYDYRGYGNSQGKSRLAAIVDDYREIVAHLNTLGYAKRLLYGISMGGVILLNAVGNTDQYTRLVVDSSPARISNIGCPERYDPIVHLPTDSERVMIVSGGQDTVVSPGQMEELLHVARSRGARIIQEPEFAHPYQDSSMARHRRRQQTVASFLSQE